jgi:hypothetical protein
MKKIIIILAVLFSAMLFTLEVSKVQANPIKLNRIEFVTYDMDVVYSNYFETGADLSNLVIPDAPEKEGYIFVGWSIEIPDRMPDYNLRIHAQYMQSQVVVYEKIGA